MLAVKETNSMYEVFIPVRTPENRTMQCLRPCYFKMQPNQMPIGKGITLREGSDCTIAACGITVKLALDAAEILQKEGISCRN